MKLPISTSKFQSIINYNYKILKEGYYLEIEKATDKSYAKTHYKNIISTDNDLVPYTTILFHELYHTYNHYNKLNRDKALEQTYSMIENIKTISRTSLNESKQYLEGNRSLSLTPWYIQQLNEGGWRLQELIILEEKVLQYTDENLVGSLAIHLAGKKLYWELEQEQVEEEPTKNKHNYQFTRNEQILSLYFLFESFSTSIYKLDADRTKIAALFHLIMGVSYENNSKLKDLSIYKSLSTVPQVVKSDKQLLKYLQKIRPYFDKMNLYKAVELIDKQIRICQEELKD